MDPPLSHPSLDVSGRFFVVTGGTQGLGLEIAKQLKQCGASGVVLVSRSPSKAEAAIREIGDHCPSSTCHAVFVKADMAVSSEVSSIVPRAVEELAKHCGSPIVITGVVNAAALTARGNLASTTPDMFDSQFSVNVRGPFLLTQAASKHMIEAGVPRGLGSVVNICSVAADGGAPFIMGYSCAKSALVTLTKNNAAELAPKGIRVNGINMGWTLTENEHKLQSEVHKNERWHEEADKSVPLGRILRPADVASSVLFLLSGASTMMTGAILDLHPEIASGMLSLASEDTPNR